MKRKERIISIEVEDTIDVLGESIPEIATFRIRTNEGTEAVFACDQLDKYKLGMIIEVSL